MSAPGRVTALAAEAALWITGAALIAGAAGMQWSVDLGIDTTLLTGPTPYIASTQGPSASPAGPTLAPGASPTISPVAQKYQAYVARADYQIKAKYVSTSPTDKGDALENGTISYKGGDISSSSRESLNAVVSTTDLVQVGANKYWSINGAPWSKSSRPAWELDYQKLWFGPAIDFVDMGVETKNGALLHRLEPTDPTAFNRRLLKIDPDLVDAYYAYVVWVHDDGVPAAIAIQGWSTSSSSVKSTATNEYRIIATSGVTIVAPKV